eukprot:02477.XXX_19386_18217_1 [CDS] Oithona nana genome sequencing.
MFYKLSALELEILKDRAKILKQFRESQETRRKSLKPPILVVPYDPASRLICFITRDDNNDSDQDSATSESEDNLSKWQKFRKRCRAFFKNKSNEANVHHPTIKKHQKRLTSGAATGISCAVMEATGTLMASGYGGKGFDPMLDDINPLLSLKCDVCVLSEERQVFRLLDAILESDLWPQNQSMESAAQDRKTSTKNGSVVQHNTADQESIQVIG